MSTFTEGPSLSRLRGRQQLLTEQRRAIVDRAAQERRDDLTDAEASEFRTLSRELADLDERIAELDAQEQRQQRLDAVVARMGGQRADSRVYGPESRNSYVRDLASTVVPAVDSHGAHERLQAYAQEQRDLSRTDGAGGHFVPPAHLVNEFVGLPRPGRVTADLLTRRVLPPNTDTITVPKIVTGTRADIQPADNDPVVEQDITDTSLSAPVRTIAGQQDVALQLLDQSPVNMDDIVLRDLLADYTARLNLQVISGSGAAGQLTGLRNLTGITTIAVADQTAGALYRAIANATQKMGSTLYASPSAIVMHPRRWSFLTTMMDSTGRPLIVPNAYGPTNAVGVATGGASGAVGTIAGLPVYVDGSLPTNLGIGANEDPVLVINGSESHLFESAVRTRVLPEILSGNLAVRIQAYSYVALLHRQPGAITVLTGLTAPTF